VETCHDEQEEQFTDVRQRKGSPPLFEHMNRDSSDCRKNCARDSYEHPFDVLDRDDDDLQYQTHYKVIFDCDLEEDIDIGKCEDQNLRNKNVEHK